SEQYCHPSHRTYYGRNYKIGFWQLYINSTSSLYDFCFELLFSSIQSSRLSCCEYFCSYNEWHISVSFCANHFASLSATFQRYHARVDSRFYCTDLACTSIAHPISDLYCAKNE